MRTRTLVAMEENPAAPDPTLLWYSRAVGVMRGRKVVDPTSWRWQGAVHDYSSGSDPYASPGDPLPSGTVQARYWKKCQHQSWFFLPWHRMYLYHFEQMIAAAVVAAGGPADWTLPYWDYGPQGLARKLPWWFRQPTWPGGETNYLYVAQRAQGLNAGTTSLGDATVSASAALGKALFPGPAEFGGPKVRNHGGGHPSGAVEASPHNNVHGAVGGGGWMSYTTTAALDPIFWLHHCNIDRLWEVWVRQTNPQRANPAETAWTDEPFELYGADGVAVTMTPGEVVDTRKLGYEYDGLSSVAVGPLALLTPRLRRPFLLGATARPLSLRGGGNRVKIPTLAVPPRPGPTPPRVLLHLEQLTSPQPNGTFDVFLNLPEGVDPALHPERHVGRVSLFGPKRRKSEHARDGFGFVLDVTDAASALAAGGAWDPAHVQVSFHATTGLDGGASAPEADVTVGRVSVNAG